MFFAMDPDLAHNPTGLATLLTFVRRPCLCGRSSPPVLSRKVHHSAARLASLGIGNWEQLSKFDEKKTEVACDA